MKFKEVIGHERIKKHLINMVKENRVSHAQLFCGPEGVGKVNLALAFAQFLNCQNRQDDDSCGECASCVKYGKLIHPDLHFVFPVVKSPKYKNPVSDSYLSEWRQFVLSNAYFDINQWFNNLDADKQGLIYSQESQEIIKKLSLKTFEAKYKVMIIWLPEKMHVAAANKLLKLLEEPPEGTVFLLVSDNPNEILGTIQSRAQRLNIPALSIEDISGALHKEYSLSAEECERYAKLSVGNYVAAREIINQSEERTFFFDKFVSLMRLAYGRKLFELIDWCDEMNRQSKERQKNFFEFALRLIRENFMMNIQEKDLLYLTPEEENFSVRFSPFINDGNVLQLSEEFSLAHSHLEQNGNARIILMDLCLKVIMLLKQ
ncbi:DNA polymerase III subunit delta' [Carboxylicivirga mesophila]|uniref:DNA polymerase III subunit delta n=1 Tax=Carboxylicivirga mesophila TaxID=1166478 RepID=A0ABS5K5U7_9BACT|nr:DNA polymerase III subunit delta' [Carboxylicivirga mesophila]MBS2210369.1 DNA polymerase III subunit delta' [Carboxylicivirga mesophila]